MKITDVRNKYSALLENLPDTYKYSWKVKFDSPSPDNIIQKESKLDFSEDFFQELDKEEKNKDYYYGLANLSEVELIKLEESKILNLEINENISKAYLIETKENTNSTLIISSKGTSKFNFEYIKVLAKPNSSLNIIYFQNIANNNFQFHSANVEENANVNWAVMHAGSTFTKNFIINSLKGNNSKGNINIFYYGKEKQNYDLYTSSVHIGEETTSNIITKGALSDFSRALSRGLVRIESNAKNSAGYETQEAILLSKDAIADAIPNLEIHNEEVTCSHGSSITQIDEDQIMYLMSRGYSKEDAENKLVEGFFIPTIDEIKEENLRETFKENIINIIENGK